MTTNNLIEIGWALSSPFDDDLAHRAAHQVLSAPDTTELLSRLFPILMKEKAFLLAVHHLRTAGADVERLLVPTSIVNNTFIKPEVTISQKQLWPIPDQPLLSFGQFARILIKHRQLLWQATRELAQVFGPQNMVLVSGRAMEALFPTYTNRLGYDVDLWVASITRAVEVLEVLIRELGFKLSFAVIRNMGSKPRVGAALVKQVEGFSVHLGIGGAYLFYNERLDERAVTVKQEEPPLRAASPEDMLVMLAAQVQHKGYFKMVNVGDCGVILRTYESLDFSLIRQLSGKYGLDETIGILLAQLNARWPGIVPESLSDLMHRAPAQSATPAGREAPVPSRILEPPVPADEMDKRPQQRLLLCSVANKATSTLPNCKGRKPGQRWKKLLRNHPQRLEIIEAARRLVDLMPTGNHDCSQLLALY